MHDNQVILFSWAIFYALHSLLAADRLKDFFARQWPAVWPFYRLVYNTFFLVFLLWLLVDLYRRSVAFLFPPSTVFHVLGDLCGAAGLWILFASFRNYDLLEFTGLQQPNAPQTLQTGGLNRFVRHPIYSGTLLFLLGLCLVDPYESRWAALAATLLYMPAGIYFEEKKLLRQFGSAYSDYQKRVKRLIPGLW